MAEGTMNKKTSIKTESGRIDWMITILPLAMVVIMSLLFFLFHEQTNLVISRIRYVLGDTFGIYYLIIGLGIFVLTLYVAGSKYGNIVLGAQDEKPKYSFSAWGAMMFTAGLAADILFYSFSEWILYAADPHIAELGSIQDWASVYPLFHWSLIPWGGISDAGGCFGFYASCAQAGPAKIFRSMPANSREIYGRYRRQAD